MARDDLRSLEENYDGEFSSFYGRSPAGETIYDVARRRIDRRRLLKAGMVLSVSGLAAAGLTAIPTRVARAAAGSGGASLGVGQPVPAAQAPTGTGINFTTLAASTSDNVEVAANHSYQVLLAWGDPVVAGAPEFDWRAQTPEKQRLQAGFNADFVWFVPLSGPGHGLLWNNHEYTDGAMMFFGYNPRNPTRDQVDIEIAAHGGSFIEIIRNASGQWSVVRNSRYGRRIHGETPIRISGPAAGGAFMRTSTDPTGTLVMGTLNNCGGGATPWGTVLTAEENFNQYFANRSMLGGTDPQQAQLTRYGIPGGASERGWERYHDRFDVTKEPNEPNRFGWIVEIDPYNPSSVPVKRTALGRMKHEAAMGITAPSGQYVIYTGDDERFEFVYKFVSRGTVASGNRNLLDEGTLYVAKFNDDGSGEWIPLVYGQRGLTAANGFFSQADVLIRARMAASAVGATQMDRPEDVEVNPVNRKVYVALTNNSNRTAAQVTRLHPVAPNYNGHIVEITEDNNNHAGTGFRWEIFLIGGDTDDPNSYFGGQPKHESVGFSSPDNILFDNRGNLWIATDGQISSSAFRKPGDARGTPVNDSVYAVPTAGPMRGQVRRFLNGVPGAEVASIAFNADNTVLFVAIQHPGEGSRLETPSSRWPDLPAGWPRPAVIAVTRFGGGPIGS